MTKKYLFNVCCSCITTEHLKSVLFFCFGLLNATPVPVCTLPVCCDFYVAKCFFNRCSVVLKYMLGTGRRDLNLMM